MIEKMIEEAFEGNYTSFSELFKEELGRRIHERLEDMKSSVVDNTYNVCESCDSEEDEVDEDEYDEEEEVDEALDPVDKDELKGKHKHRDDKDIDNDGDSDSTDKYLHKRRKAIGKAMKNRGDAY